MIIVSSGVVDSSGMTFYYINAPREHIAGIITIGHHDSQYMIIPPKAKKYTIYGFCPSVCTQVYILHDLLNFAQRFFPEEGIRIFANGLHTHLLGVSIKVYHLRVSYQCRPGGGIAELKPIDMNLQYDFNFQEIVHIDEVIVKRVRLITYNRLIKLFIG